MNIFLVFISLNDLNTIDRNEHFNYNGLLILVKAKKKLILNFGRASISYFNQ